MFFSTNLPPNAADIPKKKIAKLNAHSTFPNRGIYGIGN